MTSGGISKASHPPRQQKIHGRINCGAQGGGRSADRPPRAMVRCHRPASGLRASVERIVGSGSEPTYLPLTNTSCVELVPLGAASALDAEAMAMAIARAVLMNMVV